MKKMLVVAMLLVFASVVDVGAEYFYWIGYTIKHREVNFYVKNPNVYAMNATRDGNDAIWVVPYSVKTTKKTMKQCLKGGFAHFVISNGEACSLGTMEADGTFASYGRNHKRWLRYIESRKGSL